MVGFISNIELQKLPNAILFLEMTVVNNSAPRTHPNDKLRYIPKSGLSRDHTRTGSRPQVFGGSGGSETL
jgi:hypothetical protein